MQGSELTYLFLFVLAALSMLAALNPKLPPQGRIFAGVFGGLLFFVIATEISPL